MKNIFLKFIQKFLEIIKNYIFISYKNIKKNLNKKKLVHYKVTLKTSSSSSEKTGRPHNSFYFSSLVF